MVMVIMVIIMVFVMVIIMVIMVIIYSHMMWAHEGGGCSGWCTPPRWPGPAAAATSAVPEAATVHSQPRQPEREGVGGEL